MLTDRQKEREKRVRLGADVKKVSEREMVNVRKTGNIATKCYGSKERERERETIAFSTKEVYVLNMLSRKERAFREKERERGGGGGGGGLVTSYQE